MPEVFDTSLEVTARTDYALTFETDTSVDGFDIEHWYGHTYRYTPARVVPSYQPDYFIYTWVMQIANRGPNSVLSTSLIYIPQTENTQFDHWYTPSSGAINYATSLSIGSVSSNWTYANIRPSIRYIRPAGIQSGTQLKESGIVKFRGQDQSIYANLLIEMTITWY